MRPKVSLLGFILSVAACAPMEEFFHDARPIAGQVEVAAIHLLLVDGQQVALYGVDDAPRDTAPLVTWLKGHHVRCFAFDDVQGEGFPPRAICEADNRDIGAWLVRNGFANSDRLGETRYLPEELWRRTDSSAE